MKIEDPLPDCLTTPSTPSLGFENDCMDGNLLTDLFDTFNKDKLK
jgi:hypothetical protein